MGGNAASIHGPQCNDIAVFGEIYIHKAFHFIQLAKHDRGRRLTVQRQKGSKTWAQSGALPAGGGGRKKHLNCNFTTTCGVQIIVIIVKDSWEKSVFLRGDHTVLLLKDDQKSKVPFPLYEFLNN